MYALFLECEAANQIDRYVAANGRDADDIKQRAYGNIDCNVGQTKEDWLVSECLNRDSHKHYRLSSLFYWAGTKEGQRFWSNINNY